MATSAGTWRWVRPAAWVMAAAFTVHVLNGTVLERTFLGLKSYRDYADAGLLRDAVGSAPWIGSGLGHVFTAVAVVFLSVALRDRFVAVAPGRAWLVFGFGLVSATGFGLDGIGNLSAGQAAHLLADRNPDDAAAAFIALSVLVVAVNALAISSFGVVAILTWTLVRDVGLAPRWPAVLGLVAGLSGLVMAFVVAPAYLLFYWLFALALGWVAPRWAPQD